MNLIHPVSLGNLHLESNVFLAPLAGYTDRVFRGLCLSMGAALAYTEMVSCEGIFRKSIKTVALMERAEGETNLAVQLFAPDADTAMRSVDGVMKYNPALIDFNCGCPVPKVTKTGAGSALLCRPDVIRRIVNVLVSSSGLPVTVKIRAGWDCESINYLKTADAAFSGGASAVCMHARTKSQLYMPSANWEYLSDLKAHFPDRVIIGSGDLFCAADGIRMLEQTEVDAVSFARGAIGNPFVFEQMKALSEGKTLPVPSAARIADTVMMQLVKMSEVFGESVACREMRKHACAYFKGIPNGSKIRQKVTSCNTVEQYREALTEVGALQVLTGQTRHPDLF